MEIFYVYIMASHKRVTYVGFTNDLERRVCEHQHDIDPDSFCSRYKVHKLVYFERWTYATSGIAREKELKAWSREKKVKLIESMNPKWRDLSKEWRTRIKPLPKRFAPHCDPDTTGKAEDGILARSLAQKKRSG
jgi:putative endonuclease